jgi:hypothetical protein
MLHAVRIGVEANLPNLVRAQGQHRPVRRRNAGFIRRRPADISVLPDKSGVPQCRFRERIDGKAVVTHEDDEPLRNGRARSPLRAADGVNVASSRGAHGVTRPTGNGRGAHGVTRPTGNGRFRESVRLFL